MSTRTTSRTTASASPTEAEMRDALAKYITAHLAVDAIENEAKTKIEEIKADAENRMRPWKEEKAARKTTLMRFADAHPELFVDRQKVEVYGGHLIGWHITPPAVTLVRPTGEKKKQTWPGFLAACKQFGVWARQFIRTVEEPNKDEVLAQHRAATARAAKTNDIGPLTAFESQLADLGVKVTQEERFVVNLNLQPEAGSPTV